jgi:hypothetical protein
MKKHNLGTDNQKDLFLFEDEHEGGIPDSFVTAVRIEKDEDFLHFLNSIGISNFSLIAVRGSMRIYSIDMNIFLEEETRLEVYDELVAHQPEFLTVE